MPETHEIIIIGAGLSGLSAAHFLRRSAPDLDILILEQDGRPGGAVRSFQEQGYLAEWGPHGFLDNNEASRALLSETGLAALPRKLPWAALSAMSATRDAWYSCRRALPPCWQPRSYPRWENCGCWEIFSKNRAPKSKASDSGPHTASGLRSYPWWMPRSPAPLPGTMNASVSMP